MNKSIEIQAKTIEAAIEEALAQLNASYDEVDVDIIQEAGFLKKAKVKVTLKNSETADETSAPVILTQSGAKEKDLSKPTDKAKPEKSAAKNSPSREEGVARAVASDGVVDTLPQKFQSTLDFTKKFLAALENSAEVTYEITEKSFNINVNGGDAGQIIGRGGEVMNAIQTIIGAVAVKNSAGENRRVYFNVEDYKERREQTLKDLATRKAEKVKETGRYIKLEPMTARDRAIIHSALQGVSGIRTYSTGKDPYRCLCIAPAERKE